MIFITSQSLLILFEHFIDCSEQYSQLMVANQKKIKMTINE